MCYITVNDTFLVNGLLENTNYGRYVCLFFFTVFACILSYAFIGMITKANCHFLPSLVFECILQDFISCEAPLLKVPPDDLALKYTKAIQPDGTQKEWKPKQAKENAFMVCAMIDALNAAAKFYKDQHCDKATANYEYSYTFHKDMLMPEEKGQKKK